MAAENLQVKKLVAIGATGPYRAGRIYEGNLGDNEVAALMDKVNRLVKGKFALASDTMKANLADVGPRI